MLVNNSDEVNTLEGLEIEGFGVSGVKLGHVTFSSLTALKGNLNRLSEDENIDLRADDYVLDPDPVYAGLYTETEYDEVLSLCQRTKLEEMFNLCLSISRNIYRRFNI